MRPRAVQTWNRVHFSSETGEWETPQDVFDWADVRWGPLELDVCATAANTKCKLWYSLERNQDGRLLAWDRPWWCNPPYGRGIIEWVRKGALAVTSGVMLLPARTDTEWFHQWATKGDIYVLRGRLKFGGAENSAPFPSMIVRFNGRGG